MRVLCVVFAVLLLFSLATPGKTGRCGGGEIRVICVVHLWGNGDGIFGDLPSLVGTVGLGWDEFHTANPIPHPMQRDPT